MRDKTGSRYLPLAYVAAVTALLLALVAEHAARGPAGLPAAAVYALAAGFGLEFVRCAWAERGPGARERRRQPHGS